jgi:hypothetical protein
MKEQMHSTIPSDQNSTRSLDLIAASSWFYGVAKNYLSIQFVMTVLGAVTITTILLFYPCLKIWTTCATISIALLDAILFEWLQTRYRQLGAKTQELFDTELLFLPWNSVGIGSKPETEKLVHATRAYRKSNPKMVGKVDWYPKAVGELSPTLARFVCQRASLWWDKELRSKYGQGLVAVLLITVVAVFLIAIAGDRSTRDMVLLFYAPVAPAVLWCAREIRKQLSAMTGLDKQLNAVDGIWKEVLSKRMTEEQMNEVSRRVQDAIYTGRFRNPLVFNWINAFVRDKHQLSMETRAKEMVDEALRAYAN